MNKERGKVFASSRYRQNAVCIGDQRMSSLRDLIGKDTFRINKENSTKSAPQEEIYLDLHEEPSTMEKSIEETVRRYKNALTDAELARLITKVYFEAPTKFPAINNSEKSSYHSLDRYFI
ncbi:hypothetical protein Ciccas_008827 [Cichlidogyrus casuarinus]|uniref:Uncharacterized protein n=1 Tax=Cichlidogyrus casuarinus TaxID=1844966 RepID=A0ABD2Q069_9PLAT